MSLETETLRLSLEKVDFRLPTQVTDDTSILTLKNLVFEPLLKWYPGGIAHPALFDRWEHSSDGRQWTFHIRDGAQFHDGEECVASHVTDFIEAILDSRDTFGMKWSYQRYLAHAKITAEDERTIKVENPKPIANILDIFTEFYVCRVTADGQPILGTGPYQVVEFERGKSAVLEYVEGSENYNNQHRRPQRILVTAEHSAEERLSQLLRGTVDAALNLERVEDRIQFTPNLQWGTAANTLSVIYYLNCYEGIFTSPEARRAVNLAVDTETLTREIFHDLDIPSTTIVSPFHLGAPTAELKPIPYDPIEAQRLLEAIETSKSIVLRTPTYMPERAEAITSFVVKSLEAVGLTVEVEVEVDRAGYARQVGLDKKIGDMALFDSSPHSTFRVLDDKISGQTRAVWWQGFQDAVLDDLIETASQAVDNEHREEAYSACLKHLRESSYYLIKSSCKAANPYLRIVART